MAALEERSSRERSFVYRDALYPDDFDPTTYEVALGPAYLNALIDVYPRVNTVTHTITLPPASADLVGSKINFSGPANALILVKSLKNQDAAKTILVSLRGRGEFVVLNNGNGDYNWATRWLEGASSGSGSPGGTARDPYDVDTAKRKEVVDANVPAYLETNTDYYGKSFVDEVYGPGQPAMYRCMPSAPATSSGVTVWKWFRSDIL
jgi:hypothetical protein